MSDKLVDDFLARYRREIDFYDQVARICAGILEEALKREAIRAIVTNRAKKLTSLTEKLKSRSVKKDYKNLNDIYNDIVDLAGVRIALYFPSDRRAVGEIIEREFEVKESKQFPDINSTSGNRKKSYQKRFAGYSASHYRVVLNKCDLSKDQGRYKDTIVEIQVASVLMHAWSEVEHDLVYKPMSGQLSIDEDAILDELNGLVLSGEIALELLQRAVERRVSRPTSNFTNHYELGSYLNEQFFGD